MRYIGIDLGTRRIGLAFGDELGVATPLPALTSADAAERRVALLKVIGERRADEIVIGHPLNMDDSEGPKAKEAEGLRHSSARSWGSRFIWSMSGSRATRRKRASRSTSAATCARVVSSIRGRRR